jgi:hypothetical protein
LETTVRPFHAHALDFGDEVFGNAAESEAAGKHRHVVSQPGEGFSVGCHAFVESSHGEIPPYL